MSRVLVEQDKEQTGWIDSLGRPCYEWLPRNWHQM